MTKHIQNLSLKVTQNLKVYPILGFSVIVSEMEVSMIPKVSVKVYFKISIQIFTLRLSQLRDKSVKLLKFKFPQFKNRSDNGSLVGRNY